jgi:hypothetical protein
MKKEEQASLVHELRLGKRQRHAYKTGQTLPQGIIPTLDVGGFSALTILSMLLESSWF